MDSTDYLLAVVIFVLGWIFALNIKGVADRVFDAASRTFPVIGTSVTLRIMGGIWIIVGGVLLVAGLTS